MTKTRGERIGRCGLCRRVLIRPVQTVRAQAQLYHLACWRERTPPKRPAPRLAALLDALYRPARPLTRAQIGAVFLTIPGRVPGVKST